MPHNANWKRNVGFFIGGQFFVLVWLYACTICHHLANFGLQTQSGVIMSMFSCASLLPMVIISPFAGVWADRYNRKYLINISDGIIALVTALPGHLMLFGYQNIWLMLGCGRKKLWARRTATGCGYAYSANCARRASYKGKRHTGLVQAFATFASPMLAGALLTFCPYNTSCSLMLSLR